VDYSVKVQPGEWVLIDGHTTAEPLLKEVYRRVLQHGGHLTSWPEFPWQREAMYSLASDRQLYA
jgi:aminopeptidase